jgi:hypothetical protein
MKKRADDIEIGERLYDFGDICSGLVVSKMNDPDKPTRAYILIRSDNGTFTIYGVCRDACVSPFLTRLIPESVMKQFLFDAFVGQELEYVAGQKNVTRVPIITAPRYAPPAHKPVHAPAPVVEPVKPVQSDEPESTPPSRSIATASAEPEEPAPADTRILPEIDFP